MTEQNFNPYEPPKADMNELYSQAEEKFYVISLKKMIILTFATLGIYVAYWFWKHWNQWKQATDSNIWPIPRAIFCIFFTHSLFREINEEAEEVTAQDLPALGLFATIFVVIQFVDRAVDKLLLPEEFSLTLDIPILIVFLSLNVWCLWQAQKQANLACNDEDGLSNDNFGIAEYIVIALGVLVWGFFVAVGLMVV